jgi:arylsulfatase A-like enzyme
MSSASRGNVLFVTLDQWRGDCLSSLGHPHVKTPHLDALAAEGTHFRRHYAQASPCSPSRASLYTGLYLHNHRVAVNGVPLDDRFTNVAREARKAGYNPMLFGYTDTSLDPRRHDPADPLLIGYEGVLPGFSTGVLLPEDNSAWLEFLAARGYPLPKGPRDPWLPTDHPRQRPTMAPPRYPAEHSESRFLTDAAIGHIERVGERPWFVHLSYFRPHNPFIAPEPWNELIDPAAVELPVRALSRAEEARQHPWLAVKLQRLWSRAMPVQDALPMESLDDDGTRTLRALYFASICEVDDCLGRLFASLRRTGVWDRTLVVVTSDHGEMAGEHWLWGKDGYFEGSFHVPLLVRDPIGAKGARVDAFTESVDVMPTILEWLGRRPPPADGRSLMPFLRGEVPADWRREAHWEWDFRDRRKPAAQTTLGLGDDEANLAVLRGERYKYVHFAALPPLFFDLERDPGELENRVDDPDYAGLVREHAQRLLSWRLKTDDRTLTHVRLTPHGPRSRLERDGTRLS